MIKHKPCTKMVAELLLKAAARRSEQGYSTIHHKQMGDETVHREIRVTGCYFPGNKTALEIYADDTNLIDGNTEFSYRVYETLYRSDVRSFIDNCGVKTVDFNSIQSRKPEIQVVEDGGGGDAPQPQGVNLSFNVGDDGWLELDGDGTTWIYEPDKQWSRFGWETSTTIISWLIFKNVNIPKDTYIHTAAIELTGDWSDPETNGSITLDIKGIASPTPVKLSGADAMPDTQQKTSASVQWPNIPSFVAGTTYTSTNIRQIIQEIVALPNWVAGSDIMLYLDALDPGHEEYRDFKSIEQGTPAKLKISY